MYNLISEDQPSYSEMMTGTKTTEPKEITKRIIEHETERNRAMQEREQQEIEGNKSKEQLDEEEEQIGKERAKGKIGNDENDAECSSLSNYLRLLRTHNPAHLQTLK
ncbi:hypothetical protein HHI36_018451 [Cryptolaemus montrouzieri]|uniref:Uncharacterized protein n=1 Tax=Cryptolaemus montrouzieri TaxID=559131 RepID=A0ABD2NZZ2_9CUCU